MNDDISKKDQSHGPTDSCTGDELDFVLLPRDDNDPRYVKSFSTSSAIDLNEAARFFESYGFVVFREVYSPEECEETRSCMWDIIEKGSPGFDRDNRDTWSKYSSAGKYGLSMRGACFHPRIVRNRQHPNLVHALETIIGSKEVMVSHDRFTIYRATQTDKSFITGDRNVHLDINPWWWCDSATDVIQGLNTIQYNDSQDFIKENNLVVKSMGRHVQCVLNFEDNEVEDGGTILVPRFHKVIEHWCRSDAQQVLRERKEFNLKLNLEKQEKNILKKLLKEQRKLEKEEAMRKSNEEDSADITRGVVDMCDIHVESKSTCELLASPCNDVKATRIRSAKAVVCEGVTAQSTVKRDNGLHIDDISNDNTSNNIESNEVMDYDVIVDCELEKKTSKDHELRGKKPDKGVKQKKKQRQKHKQDPPRKPPPVMSHGAKWGSGVHVQQPLPWVIMSEDSELLTKAQRVPLKAGSVLMWDQTMVHGTQPNDSSDRCRMAMFLKAFDRTKCFLGEEGEARRQRRRDALQKFILQGLREASIPIPEENRGGEATSRKLGYTVSCECEHSQSSGGQSPTTSLSSVLNDELAVDSIVTPLGRKVFDI
mmetsp:Transcript_10785/g.17704  ORF Transcript_10785/g.17704 Transcript_10785/m.17704 type:complete len:596 (-) Transcript_10785:40-1827(-)